MPIHAPSMTQAILGHGLLPECRSRSLFKDRFADPQANDHTEPTRKEWFSALLSKPAETIPASNWHPDTAGYVHARLMSRLMLNMAGGVMENTGLMLDRFGLPVIPGSAVKGCARRMALQALHDWVESQIEKGSAVRPAEDDACALCCKDFATPAEMLAAIARIFGWVDQDWDAGKNRDPQTRVETTWKSDFYWACAGGSQATGSALVAKIIAEARINLGNLSAHKSFAGTFAFLTASSNADPHLELDIVTPHHTKYHQGEPGYENAPDTEDPVPVYFPTVAPQADGHYFTFPIIPLRLAQAGDLDHAKGWLAFGLNLLGIGAKTNAGYGWFEVDDRIASRLADEKKQRQEAAAAAALTPSPELIETFATMPEQQLAGILNAYSFDSKLWPRDRTPLFELTLLDFVLCSAPQLRQTKKGAKAIELLAAKYKRALP